MLSYLLNWLFSQGRIGSLQKVNQVAYVCLKLVHTFFSRKGAAGRPKAEFCPAGMFCLTRAEFLSLFSCFQWNSLPSLKKSKISYNIQVSCFLCKIRFWQQLPDVCMAPIIQNGIVVSCVWGCVVVQVSVISVSPGLGWSSRRIVSISFLTV